MPFAVAYGVLVGVQASLVLVPGHPPRIASSRLLGLALPAAALVVGVALVRAAGGAGFLAALASVATPALAAAAGLARGWRRPWLPAVAVPPVYMLAWLGPGGLVRDAAGVALIAGACIAATGFAVALAPRGWLQVGLVLLVVCDAALVWGDRQIGPTMSALQAAAPPSIGRPLPTLQQIELGPAVMGWLDFAAPALLGLIVSHRPRAAAGTGLAAALWGLLLFVTSPIAATPPVLAGLVAGRRSRYLGRQRRQLASTGDHCRK